MDTCIWNYQFKTITFRPYILLCHATLVRKFRSYYKIILLNYCLIKLISVILTIINTCHP